MADGKQPFFISGADAPLLSVAGLWDNWKNRETGETIRSCTMIVTEANPFMSEIHDRMPVFLGQETLHPWLEGEAGTKILLPASVCCRLGLFPHRVVPACARHVSSCCLRSGHDRAC
jgi:putative SOS response-associated peptidase YedK